MEEIWVLIVTICMAQAPCFKIESVRLDPPVTFSSQKECEKVKISTPKNTAISAKCVKRQRA